MCHPAAKQSGATAEPPWHRSAEELRLRAKPQRCKEGPQTMWGESGCKKGMRLRSRWPAALGGPGWRPENQQAASRGRLSLGQQRLCLQLQVTSATQTQNAHHC
ncbi:hypothetical protein VZT92_010273 [Zoarces viviparus]|uniref:Uncharacterized protein n=1 Tax=Zoarces viviparus TaxID=48416 RepID=A0AAW1FE25_ZOAVI